MKYIYIVGSILLMTLSLQAQAPNAFNFQAMALDKNGAIYKNHEIDIRITLRADSSNGNPIYREEHTSLTSDAGILSLVIGEGVNQNGNLSMANWGQHQYWIQLEADFEGGGFEQVGTSMMTSVPYALHAETVTNKNDADADPQNEIQTISISGDQLSISGGNTITIPTSGGSGDDDVTNEIQDLSINQNGPVVELSISRGGQGVTFGIQDDDFDPFNEMQTLIKNGNQIELLPAGGIIQDEVDDADADPQNEIQQLSIFNDTLKISKGNEVDLSTISSKWAYAIGGIEYDDGSVFIRDSSMDQSRMEAGYTVFSSGYGDTTVVGSLGMRILPDSSYSNIGSFHHADVLGFYNIKNPYARMSQMDSSGFRVIGAPNYSIYGPGGLHLHMVDTGLTNFTGDFFLHGGQMQLSDTSRNSFYSSPYNFGIQDSFGLTRAFATGIQIGSDPDSLNHFPLVDIQKSLLRYYDKSGRAVAQMGMDPFTEDAGELYLRRGSDQTIYMTAVDSRGQLYMFGPNGSNNIVLSSDPNDLNSGQINLYNQNADQVAIVTVGSDSSGHVQLKRNDQLVHTELGSEGINYFASGQSQPSVSIGYDGPWNNTGAVRTNAVNGKRNTYSGFDLINFDDQTGMVATYNDAGDLSAYISGTGEVKGEFLTLKNGSGDPKLIAAASVDSTGELLLLGQNGFFNNYIGTELGQPNRGRMAIFNEFGFERAGLFIDAQGDGRIFADVKHFKVDHPENPNKEIWYASLEGPEAGAYVRGSAKLIDGEAFIPFPDHFTMVANPKDMTVILTPLDWDTYGLAVVEKRTDGIRVKELKNGNGSFGFDWEVKCSRMGHENYQVIKDKAPVRSFE